MEGEGRLIRSVIFAASVTLIDTRVTLFLPGCANDPKSLQIDCFQDRRIMQIFPQHCNFHDKIFKFM